MSIREAALLFCLAPKHLIVPVRIKWRVDVDKIDARGGEFSQLVEIITAVDDARVDERRGLCRHFFQSAESEASGQRAVSSAESGFESRGE